MLTIEGELDDISGEGQTRAALDLCTGVPDKRKQHLTVEGAGHYGIFSGRRWRGQVYPQVRAFIAENATDGRGQQASLRAPAKAVKRARDASRTSAR